MNTELSVVIPVWNEEGNLPTLLQRLLEVHKALGVSSEIILVDDGSSDSSPLLIQDASLRYPHLVKGVFLPKNQGQHPAIIHGFEISSGQYVITLDADLQNPPEEIPGVLRKLREGFDVVGTIRLNRQDSFFRKMASMMVNRYVRNVTRRWGMKDYGCMLRGYQREIVCQILKSPMRNRFIPLLAMSFAHNPIEITVKHAPRFSGDSKYGFRELIKLNSNLMAVKKGIQNQTAK